MKMNPEVVARMLSAWIASYPCIKHNQLTVFAEWDALKAIGVVFL